MKQNFGRMLALALALIMLCSVLVPAYAAGAAEGSDLTTTPAAEKIEAEEEQQKAAEEPKAEPDPTETGKTGENGSTDETGKGDETGETGETGKTGKTDGGSTENPGENQNPDANADENQNQNPGENENQNQEQEQQPETPEQPAMDPMEEEYLLRIDEVLASEDAEFIEYWAKQLMGQEAFVNFLYNQSTDVRDAFLAKIAPYYQQTPADGEQTTDGENNTADEIVPVTTEASTAQELYDVLMACDTYEQIEAILRGLTPEQEALMAEFTEQQNADLSAKMEALGAYGTSTLEATAFTGTIKSVTIESSIETNGQLNLVVKDENNNQVTAASLIAAGYDIEWKKGSTTVTRTQVMDGKYTMAEDGQWVNVAYDEGAQKTYTVTISKDGKTVRSASSKVNYYAALQNGGFETPKINKYLDNVTSGGTVIWKTTGNYGRDTIEIGNVATDTRRDQCHDCYGITKAAAGVQFAELNANAVGSLYQDVLTKPGSTMHWRVSHAPRLRGFGNWYSGSDSIYVVIMSADQAKSIENDQDQLLKVAMALEQGNGSATVDGVTYTGAFSKKYTSKYYTASEAKNGKVQWTVYGENDDYVVPEGQFCTRYFFVSASSASGSATVGNLIDNVWFSTDQPPLSQGEGRLTVTKEFYGLDGLTSTQIKNAVQSGFLTYAEDGSTTPTTPDLTWEYDSTKKCYTASFFITTQLQGTETKTYTVTEDTSKAQMIGDYTLTSTGEDTAADSKIAKTATISSGNEETLTFTNTYSQSTVDLEITKTVKGNMVDETTATFDFEYSYPNMPEDEENTFTLKSGETHKIENLPIGTEVTIKETTTGYVTSWTYTTATEDEETGEVTTKTETVKDNSECKFIVKADEYNRIECINVRDLDPDTGISLDSLPYILMLTFAGAAGIFLALRKRHNLDI